MLKISGFIFLLGLVACGQPSVGAAQDLSGLLSGRAFSIPGNPFVGEVVSARRSDSEIHYTKLLMFAGLPKSTDTQAVSVMGYDVEIDCRRQFYRRVFQTSYNREGRAIDGVALRNDFIPAGGVAKFVSEVCSGSPASPDNVPFSTVEEFAQLAQDRIRHTDLGPPAVSRPNG